MFECLNPLLTRSSEDADQPHHNLEYALPVIRAPSPTSIIDTTYGENKTSLSHSKHILTQSAFEAKRIESIAPAGLRREEQMANSDPLLVRFAHGSQEERRKQSKPRSMFNSLTVLYKQVMTYSRAEVQNLEDNELS